MRVKAVADDANAATVAHLNRSKDYGGLTLNERETLSRLAGSVAALLREDSFPKIGTAA